MEQDFINGLVSGAMMRDESAFADLFGLFRERLFKTAYSITENIEDAEDALQEAAMKAWANIFHFHGDASDVEHWLNVIVRNTSLDHVRRHCSKKACAKKSPYSTDDWNTIKPTARPGAHCAV